jgi:hypothetical protein
MLLVHSWIVRLIVGLVLFFIKSHGVCVEYPVRLQPIYYVIVTGYGNELFVLGGSLLCDCVGSDFCDFTVNYACELVKDN